jgi:hypothetical protein
MTTSMEDTFTFECATCGERHTGMPDLAFDSPMHYHELSADDKARNAVLTADTCVIANRDYFVRGCVEIPRSGHNQPFAWGAWVSLSQKNFDRYVELLEKPDRQVEGPYFGWFCNRLPGYPDTFQLRTNVYFRPYPLRPRIELEPTDHPLAVEQRVGVSDDRLRELLEANGHSHAG